MFQTGFGTEEGYNVVAKRLATLKLY
jgi:hypothetical protein